MNSSRQSFSPTEERTHVLNIICQGQTLSLLPERAIFWVEERCLLIADVHFGKVAHFRKVGIPLPGGVMENDLGILTSLCKAHSPEKIIFLGDLFHSTMNKEWQQFVAWRKNVCSSDLELIRGNHDVISAASYKQEGIKTYTAVKPYGPFLLAHDPAGQQQYDKYVLAGHLHPGIRMVSLGRQRLTLPCFYFGKHGAVLPAFGDFTGLMPMTPKKDDKVYAVAGESVIDVSVKV
ncbi:MAG: ligase-associated DNA damage response endonuclease PdeM [Bacteroidota bacterium]|nr:ligase-associated DNA damage response endonuclease PdeM [Bacteroidota bacterium]